jgi:hypothetical protein
MRFMRDDQRKAMFASMYGGNKFSSKSDLIAISKDLVQSPEESILLARPTEKKGIELPEGTQSVYMINDYGSSHKTKRAATAASEAVNFGEGYKSEVVPLFNGNDLIGHAVIAWESRKGAARNYLPSSDLESMKEAPSSNEEPIKELAVSQPPIKEKWKEMEASMLTQGWQPIAASTYVEGERSLETHKAYLDDLLKAFEASGEEDFDRFREKYNKEKGIKQDFGPGISYVAEAPGVPKFSKKAKKVKKDYDGVYERGFDEFVCSYCGDEFSNEDVAAIHAAKCDKNAFNDSMAEFQADEAGFDLW